MIGFCPKARNSAVIGPDRALKIAAVMTMARVDLYDTTLRDGSQGEGVNFSVHDKLAILRRLDDLGVDYIEGGYPLSNPKDAEFFQALRAVKLKKARVAAFGMTRKKGITAAEDTGLKALLAAETDLITIVGKTWDLHVHEVIGTTPEENLAMIADSVAYCKAQGREVSYAAEHFFDGWKNRLPNSSKHCGNRSGFPSASTATTTAIWPSPIHWLLFNPARFRCRGRSMGSANAAGMPI